MEVKGNETIYVSLPSSDAIYCGRNVVRRGSHMKLSGLFEIIEDALELDAGSVTMDSSSENIEDWDSLGHITILGMLDDETSGESADIVDLTQAASVTEIAQILTDNGLLEQ